MGATLAEHQQQVVACRECPRLVSWREEVAVTKRAAYAEETYWGRPIPGFGDPAARVLIVGLAPGAHGANRTGRMFTGDRSGDFLYPALYRAGLANQPQSRSLDDGLELRDAWITAIVRCLPPANKPTVAERDACIPWTVAELGFLPNLRVAVCLGSFAWDGLLRLLAAAGHQIPRPKPKFAHGASAEVGGLKLLGCYHPSQQNTFTGKLTPAMMDGVLARAVELASPAG